MRKSPLIISGVFVVLISGVFFREDVFSSNPLQYNVLYVFGWVLGSLIIVTIGFGIYLLIKKMRCKTKNDIC